MSISSVDFDLQHTHLSDTEGLEDSPYHHRRNDKVILTLSGKQCPEALPAVMKLLSADERAELNDLGQFVVRDKFLATALLTTSRPEHTVKEILYLSQEERSRDETFQVEFSYPPFASHPSASSLSTLPPSVEEIIITVFSTQKIPIESLNQITSLVIDYQGKIFSIDKLTNIEDEFMSLQFRIAIPLVNENVMDDLKKNLFALSKLQSDYDIAITNKNTMKNSKRIIIFDLSWTLIQCDSINLLLNIANKKPNENLQSKFNNNEITKTQWLKERVKLLSGLDANLIYSKAIESLVYTSGADTLCQNLKQKLGCRLAIVSSGCKLIADAAKEHLNFDFAFGNELEVDSHGKFTGNVLNPIIDADRKAELVQMLAMQERVSTEQCVAVGDCPVSAKMLSSAGMSIAFDQPGATDDVHNGFISSRSLTSVLYLLGVTNHD